MFNVREEEFEYQWKIFEYNLINVVMSLHLYYFMNSNILIKHNGRGSYFSGEKNQFFSWKFNKEQWYTYIRSPKPSIVL